MSYEELLSIEIHNVNELIDFVKVNSLKKFHVATNSMVFYRGQSNYEWHLEPAVYRNGKFQNESIYIKEFERLRPADFSYDNNFDKLVKMQHYGLPTRLLDITTNPLVALFFACQHNLDKDGALYYFSTPTFWEDNWAVSFVTEYVFSPETCIQELVKRASERNILPSIFLENDEAEKIIIHTLSVPAHAVLPRLTNQRILQQSGGFLLFGMSITGIEVSKNLGTYGRKYIKFSKLDERQEKILCPVIKKIKIPAECKKSIVEELDLLNIDEGFLFPELEYQAKNITRYV